MIGDYDKSGVFEGAGDSARKRRCGAGIAGEVRPDIEHRNAAVVRSGHGRQLGGGSHFAISYLVSVRSLDDAVWDHLGEGVAVGTLGVSSTSRRFGSINPLYVEHPEPAASMR